MPVLTRQAVFAAVKNKLPTAKQRAALSTRLGKPWTHASTDEIARAVGLASTPKPPSKGFAHSVAKRYGVAKTFAADSVAAKVAGADQSKKVAIRQRIVRAVDRNLRAKAKELGRKLTPAEKRAIAVKSLHAEVQAIKAGKPEQKPQHHGNPNFKKAIYNTTLEEHLRARGAVESDIPKLLATDKSTRQLKDKATGYTINRAAVNHNTSYKYAQEHYDAVEAALTAGKKVPAKVLADYPELVARKKNPPKPPDQTAAKALAAEVIGKRFEVTTKDANAYLEAARQRGIAYEDLWPVRGANAKTHVDVLAEENLRAASEAAINKAIAKHQGVADKSREATFQRSLQGRTKGAGAGGFNRDLDRTGHPAVLAEGAIARLKAELERRQAAKTEEQPPETRPARAVPSEPFTLDSYKEFHGRLMSGDTTAEEVRGQWERFKQSREALKSELSGMTMKQLDQHFTSYRSGRKKAERVEDALDAMKGAFVPNGVSYMMTRDQSVIDRAYDKAVGEWTDDEIQKRASARRENRAALKKAITNPETLEEFDTFARYRGEDKLSPEQRTQYDALQAKAGRQQRQQQAEQKATVQATALPEGTGMAYATTKHTKTGADLHVVSLTNRVERDKYNELNRRAKNLGGYYSSYSKGGAIPGFQFKDEASARQFMALDKPIDGKERVATKVEEHRAKAAAHLAEQAEALRDHAQETLNQDRLANTARRAQMAGNIEGRARRDLQLAQTMSNVSEAIKGGEVEHIDRLSTKAHFEQMESLLSQARNEAVRHDGKSGHSDDDWHRAPKEEDIEFAEYPYPSIHKDNLKSVAMDMRDEPGMKLLSDRMLKRWEAIKDDPNQWRVQFKSDSEIQDLRDFADKAADVYSKRVRPGYMGGDVDFIRSDLKDYDRMQRMEIKTPVELRAALREYMTYRGEKGKADPIVQMKRDLIGQKIPGYFPTTKPIAAKIAAIADVKPGEKVLEPSAGSGAIADAVKQSQPKADITTIEINSSLSDILNAKGYRNIQGDFLEHQGEYDKILMNPPFENGQDVDHVKHAYDLLKPGGTLVSVMSEHPFFASDRKSSEFRDWLNGRGTSEKLPQGSFLTSEVSTGVNTRLVTIKKPAAKTQDHNAESRAA